VEKEFSRAAMARRYLALFNQVCAVDAK